MTANLKLEIKINILYCSCYSYFLENYEHYLFLTHSISLFINICYLYDVVFQMMKGDFYVLEYVGWETTYTEIVSNDRLRVKNTNPPIERKMFNKFEIEVPEDVRE